MEGRDRPQAVRAVEAEPGRLQLLKIRMSLADADKMTATDSGLKNMAAIGYLVLWYFFSGLTLFLNKYIMSYLEGDPTVLALCQMLMTLSCGYAQMKLSKTDGSESIFRASRPDGFMRRMIVIGCFRFVTVLLGLIALEYVAVSFTETVKSSAPAFTVLISRVLTGQVTGVYVNLSLVPVMGGLALCSLNELSFNLLGFVAAMGTNISECCQNVYSKMMISSDNFKCSPAELQFFTSAASLAITLPLSLFIIDWDKLLATDLAMLLCLLINGLFFHCQTISAYYLMDYINPVTHSVANTGKRAFLIWTSIILFGNEVTFLSGLGTAIVIVGVLLYNYAVGIDASKRRLVQVGSKRLFVERI